MKRIKIILLSIFSCIFSSCEYDYIMPDYSKASPLYLIEELPTDVKSAWRELAVDYGLNLSVAQEKWEFLVCEKDEKGNILYEGRPREKADHFARSLEVSVRCLGRLKTYIDEYYEICRFKILNNYQLEVSPVPCIVSITKDDNYIIDEGIENVYLYNITYGSDITQLIIDEVESLGYSVSNTNILVTEKDKNGKVLYQGTEKLEGEEMSLSETGAQTLDVSIEIYGWPKGIYDEKVKIGILKFDKSFKLKDINNKTLMLTEEMSHSFDILLPDSERRYNYKITYGHGITSLIIQLAEDNGYEIADNKVVIIEKDGQGNTIYKGYKPIGDQMLYSHLGAQTLEICIELYGWPNGDYGNKQKFCILKFETVFNLKEINNKTLILDASMPYSVEFL